MTTLNPIGRGARSNPERHLLHPPVVPKFVMAQRRPARHQPEAAPLPGEEWDQMVEIHCHACGGFISEPERISYLLPSNIKTAAAPHSAFCMCARPVVYGPPPGYVSSSGMEMPDHPKA